MTKEERRKYWNSLIKEWEISGEEITSFCRRRCIAKSAFYRWKERLNKEVPAITNERSSSNDLVSSADSFQNFSLLNSSESVHEADRFIEIKEVVEKIPGSGLWFDFGNGAKLVIENDFNQDTFKKLMGVLGGC